VLFRTPLGDFTGRTVTGLVLIAAGCLCMALAMDIFLNPNNVVPGGFTALAMFANRLWGWPIGVTLLVLNIPFLVWGMKVLGVQFGPKTVLAAALSAILIDVLQPYLPVVRGEPLLYTLYGGLLYGLGMALIFRANATSGGTEIPAKLLEHYRGIRLSTSLLVMDIVVLALAAFFFGLAPALYALIAAWVMARVIDAVEAGFDAGNTALIVTGQADAIRDGVMERLERGVTILRGEGGYTGEKRTVLFVAVNRRQVPELREIVRDADPDAFMVINPSHEVLGEGFKPLTRTQSRLQ
jgi:uncharacterized membrane-anchored protein YitT (DUF2179 family)